MWVAVTWLCLLCDDSVSCLLATWGPTSIHIMPQLKKKEKERLVNSNVEKDVEHGALSYVVTRTQISTSFCKE